METTIESWDDAGNRWLRNVTSRKSESGVVLDLGWPVVYRVSDLLEITDEDVPFCIDLGGRNHLGHPVYVDSCELKRLAQSVCQSCGILMPDGYTVQKITGKWVCPKCLESEELDL